MPTKYDLAELSLDGFHQTVTNATGKAPAVVRNIPFAASTVDGITRILQPQLTQNAGAMTAAARTLSAGQASSSSYQMGRIPVKLFTMMMTFECSYFWLTGGTIPCRSPRIDRRHRLESQASETGVDVLAISIPFNLQ